jgi:lipoate-protein ligase A
MLIYKRPYTDPYLNLAAEEYYIRNAEDDMCMIWINDKSVIIGKHQNAYAEINYPYIHENQIPVIRRISGGGAVYHDPGNVNFSFISKTNKASQVNFGKYTSVIINFMKSLGIEVNVNNRSSLFIGDKKFSGHAEHLYHEKILHHGTILFNTDLDVLQKSISPVKEFQSKAMPSVRSSVMNIAPLLPYGVDIHEFIDAFMNWMMTFYPGSTLFEPDTGISEEIAKFAGSKYITWEWNFGYSPAYTFTIHFQSFAEVVQADIRVDNGKFSLIEVDTNPGNDTIHKLLQNMKGILHKEDEIDKFVEKNLLNLELAGVNSVVFRESFFR